MIKQYRIERFQGVEFLVLECYERHTWTQAETEAFQLALSQNVCVKQSEFRVLLDEWLASDHQQDESFFGLRDPIPAIDLVPHMVARCAVVNNRPASLHVDFLPTVTWLEVKDAVDSLGDFLRSPHWRNTIATSVSNYGSLFASD